MWDSPTNAKARKSRLVLPIASGCVALGAGLRNFCGPEAEHGRA